MTAGDKRYDLLQVHFHKPIEEKLNGKRFDMVAHLVHKGSDGKLAVIAVLLASGGAEKKESEAVVKTVKINATVSRLAHHASLQ
jgi:carbonic anhydrase